MENQKNPLEDLANLFEHLGNTESTDNGVSYADISKGKLEAKKKYIELFNKLVDSIKVEELRYIKDIELVDSEKAEELGDIKDIELVDNVKLEELDYIKDIELVNSMIENILKF